MKHHNITSLSIEPDADGITFTLRVKIKGGGELVLSGPDAIPAFYTISNVVTDVYEDKNDYLH